GHLLGKDGAHRRKRIVAPAAGASSLLAVATFMATGSALVLECTLAVTFLLCAALFSAVYGEHYRRQEMRSDELAASFVGGEALVEAIRAAESMTKARSARTISQRIRIRRHPDTSLRVEAILNQKPENPAS
ncbi:MAG: hypothetical protein OK455_02550, partial [Thaumarchaeota archaeon]|nr:hypothetical protein [Nitrososphaerota archaeon]